MSDSLYDEDLESCSLWIRDTPPVPLPGVSRFKRWLFPALMAAVVFVLIVVLGATNSKMSKRLLSSEESVSSLNNRIESLNASLQQIQESSVQQVQQQTSDIKHNKDQLTSVFEALKRVSALDTISKTVDTLKCTLEHYINNASTSGSCCPLGWQASGSNCYFFSKTFLSWHEARDWCKGQKDSHLVVLASDEEWDFVTKRSSGNFYWIGLTDESGRWEWVNQTPYVMDRRRWMPGQPDNWKGHGLDSGEEDCAHLHNDGRLNDMHCFTRLRFICQKHSLHI